MATTLVELLSDSSNLKLEIAGILPLRGRVQEEEAQQFTWTPIYIFDAHRANSGLRWSSTLVGCALQQLRDVSIPNNVRELCCGCFCDCRRLRRVNFGSSSSLERIGLYCFRGSGVEEASIPDGVRELCEGCFKGCKSLRRVMFGSSSSLDRIGAMCFSGSGLFDLEIPSSVGAIGGGAFGECLLPGGFICRDGCRFRALDGLVLSHDSELCYCSYGVLVSVSIPDGVRELCNRCFHSCGSLRRVMFGSLSSLERIGVSCFELSDIEEVSIPDGVREM